MRSANGVRESSERWSELFMLMTGFERAIESASRLDAYDEAREKERKSGSQLREATQFNDRLLALEQHLDAAFDHITSDRLRLDLGLKMHAAVA